MNILLVLLFVVVIIVVVLIAVLPYGSSVYGVAIVTENSISIKECYLHKLYRINIMNPDNTISVGSNTVVMTVFNANTQTELFSVNDTGVGVGNCALDSPKLPDLSSNTDLLIRFQLLNSAGVLIAQNETTIVYK